jgi:nondiscriminating glutamyl-tRNA synthetase
MLAEKLKLIKPGETRTRFAPSPTGSLHLGGARTALFNYLFAQKNKGIFVLRIEDTDKERSLIKFEENILESLKWLGIEWNEFYRQSERINIYRQYLEKLLKDNKAYYCFCSESELESQKQYQMSQGIAPHYTGKCADLNEKTINKYLTEKKPAVIRFRTKAKKIVFTDLIRGKLEFDAGLMGDMVIAKNLDTPLYNFAVTVDDHEMKINHIIRGEEHISNTPRQILIQEALNFNQPFYAHLPLILAPDKTKLSKRHGANSITDFQEQGYLPETLINFMALLGWSAGPETKEVYSLPSLIKEFSLEKIQKSGAIFNIKKLDFLNGFYLRQKSIDKLTELCLPYLIETNLIVPQFETEQYPPAYGGKEIKQIYKNPETNKEISFDYLKKIISIYQERLKKLSEISELVDFFFKKDFFSDKNLLKWKEMSDKEIKNSLNLSKKILNQVEQEDWIKENLENLLMAEAGKRKDRGELLWPLRAALTGKQSSAGPFEIAEILGKQETLKRIDNASKQL